MRDRRSHSVRSHSVTATLSESHTGYAVHHVGGVGVKFTLTQPGIGAQTGKGDRPLWSREIALAFRVRVNC